MASFAKFVRPATPTPGVISDRDLDIIEAILRYRFPYLAARPSCGRQRRRNAQALAPPLGKGTRQSLGVSGDQDAQRVSLLPRQPGPIDLLLAHGRVTEPHPRCWRRFAATAKKTTPKPQSGPAHAAGLSPAQSDDLAMHFMVEMACRQSGGSTKLDSWSQGGPLAGNKVQVPKIRS